MAAVGSCVTRVIGHINVLVSGCDLLWLMHHLQAHSAPTAPLAAARVAAAQVSPKQPLTALEPRRELSGLR